MSRRYVVFIPLINPDENSTDHELLEIYSDPYQYSEDIDQFLKQEQKSINKGWERISTRLRTINLQASAHTAVEAVRKLNLKKPRWAIYQWFKPQAWLERQRLGSANPIRVSEGASAELGLALVLLSSAGGSKEQQIIATGKLRAQGPKNHDVEVLPVTGVVEKLNFILQERLSGNLPPKPLLCFTPFQYIYGTEQLGEVMNLPEVALLKAQDIEVVPISWLSESLDYLKIKSTRVMPSDLKFCSAIFLLLLGSMIWGVYDYFLWKEIPLQWVAPQPSLTAEPSQLCFDGKKYNFFPLDNSNGKLIILPESILAWYVRLNKEFFANSQNQQTEFYVLHLLFGEKTGMLLRKPNEAISFKPMEIYHSGIKLGGYEEDRVLLVLVRREPFVIEDVNNFDEEFKARFPLNPTTRTYDPEAAADYFMEKAPGKLFFRFSTYNKSKDKCGANNG